MKTIIIAGVGTVSQKARDASFGKLVNLIQRKYPDWCVIAAYTNDTILKKICAEGEIAYSVKEAFEFAGKINSEHTILFPTHLLPGKEWDHILEALSESSRWKENRMAYPFLSLKYNRDWMISFLTKAFQGRNNESYIFMGHGNGKADCDIYEELNIRLSKFQEKTGRFYRIGTMNGAYSIDRLISIRKEQIGAKGNQVVLSPFMLTAGKHTQREMCMASDSWKVQLENAGFEVSVIQKGLLEYAEVQRRYAWLLDNRIKQMADQSTRLIVPDEPEKKIL